MIKRIIAIGLSIFIPCQSWAVITLLQHVHPTSAGSCISTITANSAGDFIVMACEGDAAYASSVTDNATGGSNTYTEVPTSRGGLSSPIAASSIFYSQTTHAGATSITCTMPSGGCYGTAAYVYSGALASGSPVDASTGNVQQTGSSNTDLGAPITTTNSGDVIFTYISPANSVTAVASPYTDFIENTSNGDASADYIPAATVSNNQASWTDTAASGLFGTSVAAFLPAAGGGGGATFTLKRWTDGISN